MAEGGGGGGCFGLGATNTNVIERERTKVNKVSFICDALRRCEAICLDEIGRKDRKKRRGQRLLSEIFYQK